MVSEIAKNYKLLLHILPEIIEISGYRSDYLSKKLNMNPTTFSVKKRRGSWSVDEVITLLSIVNNEVVEEYLMLQLMRDAKNDEPIAGKEFSLDNLFEKVEAARKQVAEGKTISHAEMKNKIAAWQK